jgi:hypothetical protein
VWPVEEGDAKMGNYDKVGTTHSKLPAELLLLLEVDALLNLAISH